MKKHVYFRLFITFVFASLVLPFLFSCKNDDIIPAPTSTPQAQNDNEVEQVPEIPDQYENTVWTSKFWENNISYMEPVSFTEDEEGNLVVGKLLYTPTKILDVRSGVGFAKLYEGRDYVYENGTFNIPESIVLVEGRDFTVSNNKITLKSNKVYIDIMTYDELYLKYKEGEQSNWLTLPGDVSRYINIDGTIKNAQIFVTYEHAETSDGYVPQSEISHLPRTAQRLQNKESFNFVVYGDSIATGADSTGINEKVIDISTMQEVLYRGTSAPRTPSWFQMTLDKLATVYEYEDIVKINRAAGSSESTWGYKNVETLVLSDETKLPDLMVIAFGMNESQRSAVEFKENINLIIDKVLAKNPNCEFILMSSMESNPLFVKTKLSEFESACYEIQSERTNVGIAVCPVNSVYNAMMQKGKLFYDITSNNINHPNDFMSRVYAMTLIATLGC